MDVAEGNARPRQHHGPPAATRLGGPATGLCRCDDMAAEDTRSPSGAAFQQAKTGAHAVGASEGRFGPGREIANTRHRCRGLTDGRRQWWPAPKAGPRRRAVRRGKARTVLSLFQARVGSLRCRRNSNRLHRQALPHGCPRECRQKAVAAERGAIREKLAAWLMHSIKRTVCWCTRLVTTRPRTSAGKPTGQPGRSKGNRVLSSSRLITGTIQICPDGRVDAFLKQPGEIRPSYEVVSGRS